MNRATLYHNASRILDFVKQSHLPVSGDMFTSVEDKFALELKPTADFSLNDRLWYERKSLGTYMSGHPVELVKGKYENRVTHKLRDVPDLIDSGSVPSVLAFIIRSVVVIRGKIVIVNAEDETGAAEVNAFVSDCDPWWHLLRKDVIVAAQCMPRHSGKFSSMHFLKLHRLGELQKPFT